MRLKKHSDSETRVERDNEDVRGIMLIPFCEYDPSSFEFICRVLFLKHRNGFDVMGVTSLKCNWFTGSVSLRLYINLKTKIEKI